MSHNRVETSADAASNDGTTSRGLAARWHIMDIHSIYADVIMVALVCDTAS